MMPRTQLKIATYNLYNLNEPRLPIYRNSDGWSQEDYDKKIKWSADKISQIKADVWGFQELWHSKSIQKVFNKSGLSAEYSLLIPDNHKGQKIVCAAAVKTDILVGNPEWISTFPDTLNLNSAGGDNQTSSISVNINHFSRPVLHFKIKPRSKGKVIHIYVCHLKSKAPTKVYYEPWYSASLHSKHREALGCAISTIRRTAEATALRLILTQRMKYTETPVIILGDLNDSQESNTLNIITN